MEDEIDLSFLTQLDYEEALRNEQITEESLYQEDDQGGYNLRSEIVAPRKKNPGPTKQSASPVKKIAAPAKKIAAPSKQQQRPLQSSVHDKIQLKAPPQEVITSEKLYYSFNLESEIQKLKIPFPLIELMKNDSFKSSILKYLQPKTPIDVDFVNLQDDKPIVNLGPLVE